jgi:hypothetical protein
VWVRVRVTAAHGPHGSVDCHGPHGPQAIPALFQSRRLEMEWLLALETGNVRTGKALERPSALWQTVALCLALLASSLRPPFALRAEKGERKVSIDTAGPTVLYVKGNGAGRGAIWGRICQLSDKSTPSPSTPPV